MTITLELSAEQQRRLREGAERHDAEVVREVLIQAVDSTVEELLRKPTARLGSEELRVILDALADELHDAPPLRDSAVSRAGIYSDHP